MIEKTKLKGKFVTYIDKDAKWRTEKVRRISGNYLSVVNAVGVVHRVYKDSVVGHQLRKKGIEPIDWGRGR